LLFTEILSTARATMMSSSVAAISTGGALVGGPVRLAGGMLATGFISAAVGGLALGLLVCGLRGWRD